MCDLEAQIQGSRKGPASPAHGADRRRVGVSALSRLPAMLTASPGARQRLCSMGRGRGGVVFVDQLHVLWFSSFKSSAGSGDCALFPGSTAPTRGVSLVPRRSQVLRSRASRGHRIVGGDSPRSRQPHPLPGPGGSACSVGQKHEALSPSSNQGNDPESGCCRVCASLRGPAPGM